jgi:hypothetical protein
MATTISIDKDMRAMVNGELPEEFVLELDAIMIDEVPQAMDRADVDARRFMTVRTGTLAGGHGFNRVGDLQYEVLNPVQYAPYQEFGTGNKYNATQGFQDYDFDIDSYANTFIGAGVRQVNITPKRFFFPNVLEAVQNIIKRANDIKI